jgi:hypothetical protein
VTGLAADEAEAIKRLTSQVEDGISDAVCELLYGLARDVPEGQAIVEVGGGKDKSTVWLVRGSEAGKKNKVFSFSSQKESPDSVKADFNTNLAGAGIQDIQDTLVSRHEAAEEAARRWKGNVGLLRINTLHEYEDIKRVILVWQRHLSPDARVVIHGCDQSGTERVIRESVGSIGYFTYEQSVDTTTVLAIDGCTHYWVINSDEIGICKHCGRQRNFKRLARETIETETRKRKAVKKGK